MLAQRGAAQPRNLPMSSLHEKTGWPPAVEGTLLTPGQPPKRTTPRGVRRDAARAIGNVPLATAGLPPADGRPGCDRGRLIGHIPCLKQRKPLATRHPHLAWISVRPSCSRHPHKKEGALSRHERVYALLRLVCACWFQAPPTERWCLTQEAWCQLVFPNLVLCAPSNLRSHTSDVGITCARSRNCR